MEKTITVIIAITCLMSVSLSIFALSRMQVVGESVNIQNEKDSGDTHAQSVDITDPQAFNSIQQTSASDVKEKTNKVDDSCRIQDEQTLNKHELIVLPTETNPSPIYALPLPLPDGRIFLRSAAGTEDPIPYIPTESPKITSRTPIVPPELDI